MIVCMKDKQGKLDIGLEESLSEWKGKYKLGK